MFRVKDQRKALRQSVQDELDRALVSSLSQDALEISSSPSLGEVVEELSKLSDDVAYRDHPVEKLRGHLPPRFHALVDPGVQSILHIHTFECGLLGSVWKRPFSRELQHLGALVGNDRIVIGEGTTDPTRFDNLKQLGYDLAGRTNIELRSLEALRAPPPLDWTDAERRLAGLLKLLIGVALVLCLCSLSSIVALASLPLLAGALVQLRKLRVTPATFAQESTRLVELQHIAWALNLLTIGGFVVPGLLLVAFIAIQNQLLAGGLGADFAESIFAISAVLMVVVMLWISISVHRIRRSIVIAMMG